MSLALILSIILKGIGAVLEILLQIFITRKIGVSGYGSYSTWINMADLIFWIFFSGIVKCNTFYLSGGNIAISSFKKKYYSRYVLPVFAVILIIMSVVRDRTVVGLVICISCLELLMYDQSSTLLARGKMVRSLVGEYVLGRLILLVGVWLMERMSLRALLTLYMFQYVIVLLVFLIQRNTDKDQKKDVSSEVSLKKWGAYQWADLMYSMISQMPVVLQYFFAGAFEAGVVSIVLLVKKLINFISGPTAKIFLPEFSRMYRNGKEREMREYYASIMRLQMLFVGPLAVVLLGFPEVILNILSEELLEHTNLFIICSGIFLLTATLGPCGGIMQMTGNEKMDNRCREWSLVLMLFTMFIFRKDHLFVLYCLCMQAASEAVGKYYFVCKWMKKAPVRAGTYIKWWIVPVVVIIGVYLLNIQDSVIWMAVLSGAVFLTEGIIELKKSNGIFVIKKLLKRMYQ